MVAQAQQMDLGTFMALPNDGNRHELVRFVPLRPGTLVDAR